jgi:arabinofuranosyltransferase
MSTGADFRGCPVLPILRDMGVRTAVLVFAFVCGVTSVVWFTFGWPVTGIDDANIFLAYARNISAGQGFVFNPGGERVEGFTSLLWVLVSTAAVTISNAPERVLLAVNILLVTLTAILCLRSSVLADGKSTLSVPWSVAYLILLLSDFFFVAWNTVALMETALWGTLLTIATLSAADSGEKPARPAMFALVISLMALTRPEALAWAPALIAFFYLGCAAARGRDAAFRLAMPAVIAYATLAVALTIFRLAYFGYPLPNTYYAKVSPSLTYRLGEGATYLGSYVVSGPVVFLCACAIVVSLVHVARMRLRDTRTLALNSAALMALAVPAAFGGDHFDGFRFYQSVYPILLLNLFNCARFVVPQYARLVASRAASARLKSATRLVLPALLIGLFVSVRAVEWVFVDYRAVLGYEFDIAEAGRVRGMEANALFHTLHPHPSIGTITVGGLKYAYNGDVIDLMGLNNTRMAHNGGSRVGLRSHAAFEKQTFYELKPTVVVPLVQFSDGLAAMDAGNSLSSAMVALALKGLLDDPEFRKRYQLAEVRTHTREGEVRLAAWYDRAFLTEIDRSDNFEVVTKP